MKAVLTAVAACACLAAAAERQPLDRYRSIIDRQMFGRPPPNFDPSVPASQAAKGVSDEVLSKEQEAVKNSIHFSVINVTPDGATAVGFTDNSDSKAPVHYYLKVGEERNGWKVVKADPVKATMTVVKGDVEVSLELGANSAKAKGDESSARQLAPAANASGPGPRKAGILSGKSLLRGGDSQGLGASLRERRAAKEQARLAETAKARELEAKRQAEAAEKEKERDAQLQAEREERRRELQLIKDELKAQREAAERERAERERAEREAERKNENADDEN